MRKVSIACIIDDDPIFVSGIGHLMKLVDFCDETLVYRNGQQALESLLKRQSEGLPLPGIILLDLNMPILDGWEFLDHFPELLSYKDVPLFVVSSSVDPEDVKRAHAYPFVKDYVIKPLNKDQLLALFSKMD